MQINLKQKEIIDALRQYITQQGINLKGKTVDCAFTAGRKDSGISVEIQIVDQDIPGFSSPDDSAGTEAFVAADPVEQPAEVAAPKTAPILFGN